MIDAGSTTADLLTGKRVLLVEDDFLIADMAAEMLDNLGIEVVGPAGRLESAVSLAETEKLDAAILDINVRGSNSDVVAAALRDRRIPFVFATGYGHDAERAAIAPVIAKPYTQQKLARALTDVLDDED